MSKKESGYPKYINDFSKALAAEVRILLAEVGKLRDERRALQHEISELMSVKSKHGAGGEYAPDWQPRREEPPPPPPPPPMIEPPPGPARPAWRVVHKRVERKEKAVAKLPRSAPPAPAPPPPIEAPKPLPAWAQWRPNPLITPAPVVEPAPEQRPESPARQAGLFGPPTPPPK